MSEKEKKALLETIKQLTPEDKAFVTGYAAGVVAKVGEQPDKPKRKKRPGRPVKTESA